MLTTLQIVLLSVTGAFALATLVFFVMFVVEISVEHKAKEEAEVKSVYLTEVNINNEIVEEKEPEVSVDEMLANLDEQTKDEIVEEKFEEKVEEKETVDILDVMIDESAENKAEEIVEEEAVEETAEEVQEVEETAVETVEKLEPMVAGSVIDYKARLEKIIENRNKIERDLAKVQKSILKYERTKRRKNRNQKMLDRRAGELTNLNLVMYSVTDIKNVDEDKKVKQEELTAHIAELKASIQDAEEFIQSNKEKNDHNVKMAKFLIQEKARYNEEIAELQEAINKSEDSAVSA